MTGPRNSPTLALPDLPQAPAQDFNAQLAWTLARDAIDPLAALRGGFVLPRGGDGRPVRYLCGHSLGLAPLAARAMIDAEIIDWERMGVRGHEHADTPWIGYTEHLHPALAGLTGAQADEVVAMNSLSVNLHLLMASFYRPTAQRGAILIERGAFSSDRHAIAAQIAWHGLDPAQQLIELAPRAGEDLIRLEDIEARLAHEGQRIALVLWPGVQYLTGQNFDLRRIAAAAHAQGCTAGFDLAHAIGNVPLSLHDDQADFAVWCSYKYLNAGPGAIGGAFVHQRHTQSQQLPRLAGWWGNAEATRFQMRTEFEPAAGAASWAVSNPPIFAAAALRASLPLFAQAGADALLAKSRALTGYLQWLVQQLVGEQAALITPADPVQRGCQLSFRIRSSIRGESLLQALTARGVVADWRQPDVLRLTPVPLYNRFEDVLHAAHVLAESLRAEA